MEHDSEYSGVLVLSVWGEGTKDGQLRARILARPRLLDATYEGSIDDVVDHVRRWLELLDATSGRPGPGDRGSDCDR